MRFVLRHILANWLELFMSFTILSNLFVFFLPSYLYYIGLALIGYKMTKCNVRYSKKNGGLFVMFMLLVCISSIVNMMFDLRFALFCYILIVTCPIYTSLHWHLFKKRLLGNFFIGFVVVVIVNMYAKFTGFNLRAMMQGWEDLTDKQFSGFCDQPMWLAAASAVSTVYCAYLVFSQTRKTKKQLFSYILLLLSSIYITMVSGSRSAFVAAMGAVCVVLYLLVKNKIRLIKYIASAVVVGLLLSPIFLSRETMGAMLAKQEYQEVVGRTSRDYVWQDRMAEFKSSPLIGVGFGAHGVGDDKEVGRVETGGGWISILSQTGIIGLILALSIILKAFTPIRKIRQDISMTCIYAIYFFFCVHSIVEGYMFQGGWYLCLIFWMVIGLLIENKQYGEMIQKCK
ncbi:MAG: O-antigen ligase family protein [Prevotella sp.]|nr:O-antigen ligase family protein [Prevotella sp.]